MKPTATILAIAVLFSAYWIAVVYTACDPPADMPAGSYWISNEGCHRNGTTEHLGAYCINGTNVRCHCQNFCGYICEKNQFCGSGSSTTVRPSSSTTRRTTTTRRPTSTTRRSTTTTRRSTTTTRGTTANPCTCTCTPTPCSCTCRE